MSTANQSREVLSPTRGHDYRPVLLAVAALFAALAILYSAAWMYYVRREPTVEIGIDTNYLDQAIEVTNVYHDSPAEKAGLKPHDRITAINGVPISPKKTGFDVLQAIWVKSRPGDKVILRIERPGEANPLTLTATFRDIKGQGDTKTLGRTVAEQILGFYPVLFLIVGLAVLFLRVDNRDAWLVATVFVTFITVPDVHSFAVAPDDLRHFLFAYRTILGGLLPGLFYFFFAVFPTRSPIDRKAPWLKWLIPGIGICLGYGGVRYGNLAVLPFLQAALSERMGRNMRIVYAYGTILLGVLSLILNLLGTSNPESRRKLKVIVWGTTVGITPVVAVKAAEDTVHFQTPFWLGFFCVMLLFLFPLSFAYAVVKHRVMDVPVLLKRSARYFVVERGFVFLILAISVGLTFWFGQAFSEHFSAGSKATIPIGATFGVLMITGATQVHRRVRTRLDRAFFRSSYDAQLILENLAAKTLNVSSREELASLLHQNIGDALHPSSMFVYLEASNGLLRAYAGGPPPEAMALSSTAPEIVELAERSGPRELMPEEMHGTQLAPLEPECLVPIRGSSDGRMQGLAVLGPRLSEESYSAMDKSLLASVASQAGIAMRSITLAEKMAQTMEAERRSEQEMQIARQVQSRLLPQQSPSLKTLDCAGKCIQTRAVGGDYYDFLDFGSGRLGLVLADIAGKGISGALLMANLQANLRSQYATALEDLPRLLRSVNHLFYKNTENNNYATTFFAVYDDENRRLRYVNCGHNPPIVLRDNGDVERLAATATVLGLFEEWDCAVAECELASGDVLVIYTDGISEAGPNEEEEFGDERLIEATRKHQQQSAGEILDNILSAVQQFNQGEQADDMTLIVARCS
jgi:sigma-B regulation protein RsbU (phosphoserine phosphatase)